MLRRGPATRDQLVAALGVPRTTIHDAIHLLERHGLVRRYLDRALEQYQAGFW